MSSKAATEATNAGPATPRAAPRRIVRVGLVGKGIQLSRSPAMHEAEGRRQQIDYSYRLFDVDEMGPTPPSLSEIVRIAQDEGYSGLNITHPYKQAILVHLDRLSDNAKAIGSVNTVVFANGQRSGHNTDLWGFRESFAAELDDVARKQVLLLGAGGAGAAVGHALLELGVEKLLIGEPDETRAQSLLLRLQVRFGEGRASIVEDMAAATATVDGLVNATPVGMASQPGTPIETALLRPEMWVADVIYFPLETELLAAARIRGCRTMSGEGMAIFQAVRAFEHFAGTPADAETMRAAFAARNPPAA